LLLPGERKSVEPMAARLAPDNVRRMHQSLHHLVADAPWNDEEMLAQVRREVLPTMQKNGSVVAWIVDDTGFPSRGNILWVWPGSTAVRWVNRTAARWP
jgi:SRSO17 transposase